MAKKLYRTPKDGILFGVSSGIGTYFDTDPVFIRLGIVVLALITDVWLAVLAYAVLFFVMPVAPSQQKVDSEQSPKDVTPEHDEPARPEPVEPVEHMDSSQNM